MGGFIVPGIELMQQALISNAERINVPVQQQVCLDKADDTQSAIKNGACFATVAMIDRAVNTLLDESGVNPKCIISGGMAGSIKPFLQHAFEHEPNLVLQGLSILHEADQ